MPITLRQAKLLDQKYRHIRDCFECGDQHDVNEMYARDGYLICEPCLQER